MSSDTKHDKKIIELLEIMICPKTGGELFYDKDNQVFEKKRDPRPFFTNHWGF